MDPFKRAVDTSFERLGIDGVLDPDGAARAVRLLQIRPDEFVDVGSMSIQNTTAQFAIRPAEMDGFGKGAILEVSGDRFRVQTTPAASDPRRLKLTLNTVQV